jgi:hypothetical protein
MAVLAMTITTVVMASVEPMVEANMKWFRKACEF